MLAGLVAVLVACFVGFIVEWQASAQARGGASFRELTERRRVPVSSGAWAASRFLAVGFAFAIVCAVACRLLVPALRLPGRGGVWLTAGAVVATFATALRASAVVALGRLFDRDGLLQAHHVLVQSGPYRIVRHPAYAANLLFAFAAGLFLANWASAVAAPLVALIAHAPRIRFEEALLRRRFRTEYETYTHQTGGLLPRPHRRTSSSKAVT